MNKFTRALSAVSLTGVLVAALADCSASSKSSGSSNARQTGHPDYFGCNSNDAYLCSSSAPAAGNGVIPDNPPAPTNTDEPPPPPGDNYSTGGEDCKFYVFPGNTGISKSQDGKTLYGGVQVHCQPLPRTFLIVVTLYYLPLHSNSWQSIATSPPNNPTGFVNDTVFQAKTPCNKSGYFAVGMISSGLSAGNRAFSTGSTAEPQLVNKSTDCKGI